MCRCGSEGQGLMVDLAVLSVGLDDLFQPQLFRDSTLPEKCWAAYVASSHRVLEMRAGTPDF